MVETVKEMKWAITGAGGQLGRELSEVLQTLGQGLDSWNKNEMNIAHESCIKKIVEAKPDLIVNCAAWTDVEQAEFEPKKAFEVNQQGVIHVATAAKELGVPLVHISTDYVFSGESFRPWRISDQAEPKTTYGQSKLAGERELLSIYPEGSYVVRTAWLYSKFGSNFPKAIIKRVLNESRDIAVVQDQVGQPTSAKDLSLQIVRMIDCQLPFGVYHATNSGEVSWFEFSQYILHLMGMSPNKIVGVQTNQYMSKSSRPRYSVLDHSHWNFTKLLPMRNWKIAFHEIFNEIFESAKEEIKYG